MRVRDKNPRELSELGFRYFYHIVTHTIEWNCSLSRGVGEAEPRKLIVLFMPCLLRVYDLGDK